MEETKVKINEVFKDKKLGCGEYVEEKLENGMIGFVCGDLFKGIRKICERCSENKNGYKEKGKNKRSIK